ncbi:MAG: AraC family transcriptional regulator [Chloroflexi bacterium]|nr:AraC family transcriptional regulator [Chloroflexota bacterium]
MTAIKFDILPPPAALKNDVECFRAIEYSGDEGPSINVCISGLPGIVFQHHHGCSPIERIVTPSGSISDVPTLYIYGQITQPGIMKHKAGPYTMTQVVLKPHALNTLLSLNAAELTNTGLLPLDDLYAGDLNDQLLEADNQQDHIALLTKFLLDSRARAQSRDKLVEESLRAIHKNAVSITVCSLLAHLNLSERQFERRFIQTVGLAPQFYIRVKRFNEAVRLMKTGRFERLTDVAHALNFYDQSHFIRDIKAFSGITPKSLSQKVNDFDPTQRIIAFV